MDPDLGPFCPQRMDPDPDPVNIRPDTKPCAQQYPDFDHDLDLDVVVDFFILLFWVT